MIRFHLQHFLRAIILMAFASFFIQLHVTGEITKYINPKYVLMSQIAASIFLFFFCVQLFRIFEDNHDHDHCPPGCTHDHGYSDSWPKKLINSSIILFPLVTGFGFSPTVLDSSIAAKKGTILPQGSGVENNGGGAEQDSYGLDSGSEPISLAEDEAVAPNNNFFSKEKYEEEMKNLEEVDVIEMKDDLYASYSDAISMEPKKYVGRTIKISGFIYKEAGLDANQVVLSRFLITHCIADASIIGFLAEFEQDNKYEQDTWIEIEGTLDVTTFNGVELPLIKVDKSEMIEEPVQPYIYPVLMKIVE